MDDKTEINNLKYEITLASHLKQIKGVLYGVIVGGGIIAIATHELDVPIHVRLLLPVILSLILCFDALVLHVRYWLLNRNTFLTLSDECIGIIENGSATEIHPCDIENFELNLTRPFFDNGPVWGPGEDYLYALIRLKSGKEFIITSLLLSKLKFPERFMKISVRKQRLRAWI